MIKYNKQVSDFIIGTGNILSTPMGDDDNSDELYFIPMLFKKTDGDNIFEAIHLKDAPKYLKLCIMELFDEHDDDITDVDFEDTVDSNKHISVLKSNFIPENNSVVKDKWNEIKKSINKDDRIKGFDKK